MTLLKEIYQQPGILANSLSEQWKPVQAVANELRKSTHSYIFLAARGTSDHAGLYLKYLFGAYNHLPVALAAPSLFSVYHTPPDLTGALVIAISQSGKSPDILAVVEEGKRQEVPTLAITNDLDSPLARKADFVIDIAAGKELAVAATKTYTAQLLSIAMLSLGLNFEPERFHQLESLPGQIAEVLKQEENIARAAERYCYMSNCVVLGRGYNYATAFEWSLKMKELAYVVADPYSSADFMHGPIAVVGKGFPVMAVLPQDEVFPELYELVRKLKIQHQAEMLVISNRSKALELADNGIPLPHDLPAWVSPMVSIVPAQLFCYYLTKIKGLDTETPRGLQKVTETL